MVVAESAFARIARRFVFAMLLLPATISFGCSQSDEPANSSVSGNVAYFGTARDVSGNPAGTLRFTDVESVYVHLETEGGSTIGTVRPSHGHFEFGGLAPGRYRAVATPFPELKDSTEWLTLGSSESAQFTDTLQLRSRPGLIAYPNPTTGQVTVGFSPVPPTPVVYICRLGGAVVVGPTIAGAISWNGRLFDGTVAPPGAYWAVHATYPSTSFAAELIIKQ